MPETPLRGLELLRAAVNQILEHPETWDQKSWHCGTTHCIGGWCQVLGGKPQVHGPEVVTDLVEMTGMAEDEVQWLCSGNRSLTDIYDFARKKLGLPPATLPLL